MRLRSEIIELESSAFRGHWDGVTCAIEMSDLPSREAATCQRLFEDSTDSGFVLRSLKTGGRQVFILEAVDRDLAENEVMGWRYASRHRINQFGQLVPVEVVCHILIIND